jgi:hypothetical protein
MNNNYFNYHFSEEISHHYILPFVIIVSELVIAMLLAVRSTVFLALPIAVFLHVPLSPIEFVDFSSIAFSILTICFFSTYYRNAKPTTFIAKSIPFYVFLSGAAGTVSFFSNSKGSGSFGYNLQTAVLTLFILIVSISGLVIGFRPNFENKITIRRWSFVLPLFLLCWGSSNYLGLSTTGTFSMFSNIETEGDEWNHLFIPKSVRFFKYQDNLVWVSKMSKDFEFTTREHPSTDFGMPEIELYRTINIWRSKGAAPRVFNYSINDTKYKKTNILTDPEFLSSPFSWLEYKLLFFRRILEPGKKSVCTW